MHTDKKLKTFESIETLHLYGCKNDNNDEDRELDTRFSCDGHTCDRPGLEAEAEGGVGGTHKTYMICKCGFLCDSLLNQLNADKQEIWIFLVGFRFEARKSSLLKIQIVWLCIGRSESHELKAGWRGGIIAANLLSAHSI